MSTKIGGEDKVGQWTTIIILLGFGIFMIYAIALGLYEAMVAAPTATLSGIFIFAAFLYCGYKSAKPASEEKQLMWTALAALLAGVGAVGFSAYSLFYRSIPMPITSSKIWTLWIIGGFGALIILMVAMLAVIVIAKRWPNKCAWGSCLIMVVLLCTFLPPIRALISIAIMLLVFIAFTLYKLESAIAGEPSQRILKILGVGGRIDQ